MENVDTDAIEQLLQELERDNEREARTGKSRESSDKKKTPKDPKATLAPWEYNPYADSAEQDRLQNLANVDELLGRATDPVVPKPRTLPSLGGAPASPGPAGVGLTPLSAPKSPLGANRSAGSPRGSRAHGSPRGAMRNAGFAKIFDVASPRPVQTATSDSQDSTYGRSLESTSLEFGLHPHLEVHAVQAAPGSMAPSARFDHTAVAVAGKLILFGGTHTGRRTAVNDCFEYDYASSAWEPTFASRGEAPSPRSEHAAAAVDLDGFGVPCHMVVIGGRNAEGEALGDVHVFSMHEQAWTPLQGDGKLPQPRYGHSLAAIGAKVYMFGGRTWKPTDASTAGDKTGAWHLSSDMYVLDVAKQTWHRYTGRGAKAGAVGQSDNGDGAPHPDKRFQHASCASFDGSSIFIHGGVGAHSEPLSDLWKYDVATRLWTEIQRDNSVPRSRHTLHYLDDAIVAVGGVTVHKQSGGQNATAAVSAISSLAASSPAWFHHRLWGSAVLAPSRAGAACALLEGVLFIHGGASPSETSEALSELLATSVASSLLPQSVHAGTSSGHPEVGVAALAAALRRHVALYDLALDTGDGALIGMHRVVLNVRAPKLLAALLALVNDDTTVALAAQGAKSLHQFADSAKVCVTVANRHHDGLPCALPKQALLWLREYLYTAQLLMPSGMSTELEFKEFTDTVIRPACAAYGIEHLDSVLRRMASTPGTSPQKSETAGAAEQGPSFSRRRLEAQLISQRTLSASIESLVGDTLTSDCTLNFGDDSDRYAEALSIPLHSAIVAARSQPLRRLINGVLHPPKRPGSAMNTPHLPVPLGTGYDSAPMTPAQPNAVYTDRVSGMTAEIRFSAVDAGARTIVIRPPRADAPRQLPALESAVNAAVHHMYTGGTTGVTESNAVEVLMAAKALELPSLAAAAERLIVHHVDLATATGVTSLAPPSELVALLQLGAAHHADHVLSRVVIAAALRYEEVHTLDAFEGLPPRVRQYVRTVAEQCGWTAHSRQGGGGR
jgi:hypothetical protein